MYERKIKINNIGKEVKILVSDKHSEIGRLIYEN